MSLMRTVVDLTRERGTATADDILPYCVGVTRQQVLQAMQNAKLYGWLKVKERRHSPVEHGGRLPSLYEPGEPMPPLVVVSKRPVASVWELGSMA